MGLKPLYSNTKGMKLKKLGRKRKNEERKILALCGEQRKNEKRARDGDGRQKNGRPRKRVEVGDREEFLLSMENGERKLARARAPSGGRRNDRERRK